MYAGLSVADGVNCRRIQGTGCAQHRLFCTCESVLGRSAAVLTTKVTGTLMANGIRGSVVFFPHKKHSINEYAFGAVYLERAVRRLVATGRLPKTTSVLLNRPFSSSQASFNDGCGVFFPDACGRCLSLVAPEPRRCRDPDDGAGDLLMCPPSVSRKGTESGKLQNTKKKKGTKITMPAYLIIDTESSVSMDTYLRVLVSLAFEVVTTEDTTVQSSGYDIIRQPLGRRLDPYSLYIHGIDSGTARSHGKPLHKVLSNLATVVRKHRPVAVVGHDVQGDVGLLISECLRSNLNPNELFGDLFRRLVCTKIGSAVLCGIPLPDGRYGRHKKNYTGSPPPSASP